MSFRSGRKHNLSFFRASRRATAPPTRRAGWFSGGVNFGGIHQHDWDVILNRINAAALATLQTVPRRAERNRLLTDRANQYVEQILSDHGSYIVARGHRSQAAKSITTTATNDNSSHQRIGIAST